LSEKLQVSSSFSCKEELSLLQEEIRTSSNQESFILSCQEALSQKDCKKQDTHKDLQEVPIYSQKNAENSQKFTPQQTLIISQEVRPHEGLFALHNYEENIEPNTDPPTPAAEVEISFNSITSEEQLPELENYTTDMDETDDEFTACPDEPVDTFLSEISETLAQTVAEYACMFFQF